MAPLSDSVPPQPLAPEFHTEKRPRSGRVLSIITLVVAVAAAVMAGIALARHPSPFSQEAHIRATHGRSTRFNAGGGSQEKGLRRLGRSVGCD